MQRRTFLGTGLLSVAAGQAWAQTAPKPEDSPRKAIATEAQVPPPPLLVGSPVIAGPAADSLTVLQAVSGPASGYLEYQLNGAEDWRRVDGESAGLLPLDDRVLKFRMPPLPTGAHVTYRVTAAPIAFRNAYNIARGEAVQSAAHTIRTIDPAAAETKFVVWNDTHENHATIRALHERTVPLQPDFMLWNGDQTNDVYDEAKMAGQYLAPAGIAIAADWPLAYARGNHDVRGPAARHVARFTGTPDDRFYYWFRSGPLAAIVMDTGEDKPDEHPVFAGLAGFAAMRQRQTEWLAEVIRQPQFREARHRVLFCHIPLWWSDETTDRGYWMFARPCREAWLPLLQEAGVKLVVSGHTHQATWLPAEGNRPLGQLVGGGPDPKRATIIVGHATAEKLTLDMQNLAGETLQKVEVPA